MKRTTASNRRQFLKTAAAASVACSTSGWLKALADESEGKKERKRSCLLLWMPGGPSQIDTFDPKPGHKNGGEFKAIDTAIPGVQISEHLPGVAKRMKDLAVIRSMSTKEGDHSRATYLMRTGYLPQGPIAYPTLGSLYSRELGSSDSELPNFVSVAPIRQLSPGAYQAGFLGPKYSPFVVGESGFAFQQAGQQMDIASQLQVRNLARNASISIEQADARLGLLDALEFDFHATRGDAPIESHRTAYQKAVRMMRSEATAAFNVGDEPQALRDKYGQTLFGQGCLLARRLIERGVPFVEVSLAAVPGQQVFGWDTHLNNFTFTKALCQSLDTAWSALLDDLKDRGLLETTTIVWMGEFGRTPVINRNGGRDHFPAAWSAVLGGGGIQGGQVIGKTSDDGMKVTDNPVSVGDLLATVCHALGLDPNHQNMSNVGRPIRLADPEASAVKEVLL